MRFYPIFISSAAAITISCIASAAAYYYKSRNKEVNDVMVFCKLQFNAWNCFDKFISYIEAAKSSVYVCMPSIQNPAIQGRLVKLLKEKNIKLRIIIGPNGYNSTTDFLLKELVDAGAGVKCETNDMQHKFCLVDDKVLLTGTLNWGDDRSCDHWNYVYVTNKPQLVEPVKADFYRMWSKDVDLGEALKKNGYADLDSVSEGETSDTSSKDDTSTKEGTSMSHNKKCTIMVTPAPQISVA